MAWHSTLWHGVIDSYRGSCACFSSKSSFEGQRWQGEIVQPAGSVRKMEDTRLSCVSRDQANPRSEQPALGMG